MGKSISVFILELASAVNFRHAVSALNIESFKRICICEVGFKHASCTHTVKRSCMCVKLNAQAVKVLV